MIGQIITLDGIGPVPTAFDLSPLDPISPNQSVLVYAVGLFTQDLGGFGATSGKKYIAIDYGGGLVDRQVLAQHGAGLASIPWTNIDRPLIIPPGAELMVDFDGLFITWPWRAYAQVGRGQ